MKLKLPAGIMEDKMEYVGKTVAEAIAQGLDELGISEENAKITIIEQPTKSLFGRLKGKAVVQIEKAEQEQDKTKEFINKLLNYLDIEAEVSFETKGEKEVITLATQNSSSIIGHRGEVLDAIQTLVGAVANIGKKEYKKVVVDCENYRDRREETLIKLAHKLEEKATEMKREVHLEPMSPFERRIIHTALIESQTVKTKSDGKEPNRFVIIVPNEIDEFAKPYNAGRNNGDHRKRDFNKDKGSKTFMKKSRNVRKSYGESKGSGFTDVKRKVPSGFGTYLGNSLKDKE